MSLQDGREERRIKDKNVFTRWGRRKKIKRQECLYLMEEKKEVCLYRQRRKEVSDAFITTNQLKSLDI